MPNWADIWTNDKLRTDQENDSELKDVYRLKQQFGTKAPEIPQEASRTTKRYLGQWEQLQMIDGILYRQVETTEKTIKQLVVPSNLKHDILTSLHRDAGGDTWACQKQVAN